MEVEQCTRGDGKEIRNFLHRFKITVDKGWPDDMEGIAPAEHGVERTAQAGQRRKRYIDYSMKGLDQDTDNAKHKSIQRRTPTPPGTTFLPNNTKRCIISSFFQHFERWRTNQGSDGYFGTRDEEVQIWTPRTPSLGCGRNHKTNRLKPKRDTKCNAILQLLPHQRT